MLARSYGIPCKRKLERRKKGISRWLRPCFEPLERRELLAADLDWAVALGSDGNGVYVEEVAVDSAGNTLIAGNVVGTVDLDPSPSSATEVTTTQAFVAKYNAAGDFVWGKALEGIEYAPVTSLAVGNGRIAVTGILAGSLTVDGNVLATSVGGGYNSYVVVFASDGTVEWATSTGQSNQDSRIRDVAFDVAGNVIVCGDIDVWYDNQAADLFATKYSTSGSLAWNRSFVSDSSTGQAVAVDSAGNVVLGVRAYGGIDVDPGSGKTLLTSTSGSVLIKLNGAGNLIWGKKYEASNGSSARLADVAIDASANVYSVGEYVGTVDFNPAKAKFQLPNSPDTSSYITKLDSFGNLVWAKALEGSGTVYATALAVDASGSVFVTGYYKGTIDFDPGSGVQNRTSTSTTGQVFIVKLNSAGNYSYLVTLVGGYSRANGIAVGGGRILVGGYVNGTADFDPDAVDELMLNATNDGGFIWSLFDL